jgi:hypothetical protein
MTKSEAEAMGFGMTTEPKSDKDERKRPSNQTTESKHREDRERRGLPLLARS